ncbi:hypothetical protein B0T16DRAFT_512492 [Cercophora newfieldiana]|uniref:BZIP domain-containing protein n=1 Tax=Cercophora newfieldiana TaxID=92897 RepID=A0AA40CMY4_9PEZI|nr:hypothetical protein B0T16DRAFT_512492 [Cercophora newfieldiana]
MAFNNNPPASSDTLTPLLTRPAGVTKTTPRSTREKRTLVPITPSMTPDAAAAAKRENYRVRNSDSAAKSRIRKTMAVVEGALAARGYASDVEMLSELITEAERVLARNGLTGVWDAVREGVLGRHGRDANAPVLRDVLFRRDEAVLGVLGDAEEARRQLEAEVESGRLVVHGLAFADAVARLVGKTTGDVPTYQMVVAKEELRGRIAAAAKAKSEGEREVEALRERLEARLRKVRRARGEMPALRATAVRYGQEEYFAECFGSGVGDGAGGEGGAGNDVGGEVGPRLQAAPVAAGESLSEGAAAAAAADDFAALLPEPLPEQDFDQWFRGNLQLEGDLGDWPGLDRWPGDETVDPQLLGLSGMGGLGGELGEGSGWM